METNGKSKYRTNKLLESMLDEDIVSKLGGIPATELLQTLGSKNILESAKFLVLGLAISVMINKKRLSDLATLSRAVCLNGGRCFCDQGSRNCVNRAIGVLRWKLTQRFSRFKHAPPSIPKLGNS